MTIRWQFAALALVLAIFTWFLVTGREKVESWVPVPVEMIGAQEGLIIHEGLVNQLEVRVRGPKELVRSLKEQKLGYPLDVSSLKVGKNSIELDPAKLDISEAYEIMEIKPPRMLLTVDRMSTRNVPVHVTWTSEDKLNKDYVLKEIQVSPAFVTLTGPESLLKPIDEAGLELDQTFADRVPERWGVDLPLLFEEGVEAKPGLVHVQLSLEPRMEKASIRVENVVLDAPEKLNASLRTREVTLDIEGPAMLLRDEAFRKDIAVSATIDGSLEPGRHRVPFSVTLPDNCTLLGTDPDTLTVIVK
jgi:YbbR domain-containing protein